jgi:hypothetical protein
MFFIQTFPQTMRDKIKRSFNFHVRNSRSTSGHRKPGCSSSSVRDQPDEPANDHRLIPIPILTPISSSSIPKKSNRNRSSEKEKADPLQRSRWERSLRNHTANSKKSNQRMYDRYIIYDFSTKTAIV